MGSANRQKGFSLVEVIIVIAIISILAAVGIPNLLSYLPKSRLSGAARIVAGDLMATRMEAVKLNRTAYMEHQGARTYQIAYLGVVLRSRDLNDDYADVSIADFNRISFNSRGAGTGSATVTLSGPGGSKTISVNIAGRVKIN
jgi:prepilin-type N-terminal cleavage/methylation domain-containing protein